MLRGLRCACWCAFGSIGHARARLRLPPCHILLKRLSQTRLLARCLSCFAHLGRSLRRLFICHKACLAQVLRGVHIDCGIWVAQVRNCR